MSVGDHVIRAVAAVYMLTAHMRVLNDVSSLYIRKGYSLLNSCMAQLSNEARKMAMIAETKTEDDDDDDMSGSAPDVHSADPAVE